MVKSEQRDFMPAIQVANRPTTISSSRASSPHLSAADHAQLRLLCRFLQRRQVLPSHHPLSSPPLSIACRDHRLSDAAAYAYMKTTGIPEDTCMHYAAEVSQCSAINTCRNCMPDKGCFAVKEGASPPPPRPN